MIKRFLLKTALLLIIFNLPLIGVTDAMLADTGISLSDSFSAGVLDLTLRSGQNNFVPADKVGNMKPGDSVARDIYVGKTAESMQLGHGVSYQFIGGNEDFCSQLQLKIWYNHYHGPVSGGYGNRDMRLKYDGSLALLVDYTDIDFIISHPDDQFDTDPSEGTEQWFYYHISVPSDLNSIYQNKTCEFNLIFNGGQVGDGDFHDEETLSNTLASGSWEVSPPPEPDGVVINELMWMGSTLGSGDEWLELRNMTDQEIDIGGWQLTKKSGGSEVFMLEIPLGEKIPVDGFYLISEYDEAHSKIKVTPDLVIGAGDTDGSDFALANDQLQIKLYSGSWDGGATLIDTADDGIGSPAAGDSSLYYSMERNAIPSDGTQASDWHSCLDDISTGLYWDGGATERGTPGATNLSENDASLNSNAKKQEEKQEDEVEVEREAIVEEDRKEEVDEEGLGEEVEEESGGEEDIEEELPPELEELAEEQVVEQSPATEPEGEEETEPEDDLGEIDEQQTPVTEPPTEIQSEEESSEQTPLPEEENNSNE